MIAIIDYGMGNIHSVQKALETMGAKTIVTNKPRDLEKCDKAILPGVGAFEDAVLGLKRQNLIVAIKEHIKNKKIFLGICLGMQLLFEESEEASETEGLGILKGAVKRFEDKKGLKIPHIGWNQLKKVTRTSFARFRTSFDTAQDSFEGIVSTVERLRRRGHLSESEVPRHKDTSTCPLLKDIPDNSYVYFCHSYYPAPNDEGIIAATTDYGIKFTSIVWKDNIYGVQFHPEKSQAVGLKMLENFVRL